MFDPQQRLLIANPRFSEIFKVSSDKLTPGTSIREVMALAQAVDKNPAAAAAAQRKLSPNHQPVQLSPLWPTGALSRSRIGQFPMAVSWPLSTM